MAEESALAVLDKLKTLSSGMAESFASSFAKGTASLLIQQDQRLASREQFPLTLPEPLVEETPLQYSRKGKRRAMTGLEIAEERERDDSRQRRRDERSAAALAVADYKIEAQERERQEEEEILAANWVADKILHSSSSTSFHIRILRMIFMSLPRRRSGLPRWGCQTTRAFI
jgi:hypothetical protein